MRRAGLAIPLFACHTTRSWGIGEIGDVAAITKWLSGAGQSVLQLLPLNEMAEGQQSPYSATSAMAIDPIFIRLAEVPDFAALGGEEALGVGGLLDLSEVRRGARVDYARVRRVKQGALAASFERFHAAEWCRQSERSQSLQRFIAGQAWWLDGYALFRAIHDNESGRPWTEWPEPLRLRRRTALERAGRDLAREVLFYQYVQWIANGQWQQARSAARLNRVALFGDLPFMVDGDSADVWLHQNDFHLDVSTGVPPDAFSATGQDWGMPVYRWESMADDGFSWIRDRARRSADLYDGFRVDHLVGFYRTYGRPRKGGEPFFTPATEEQQLALGEGVLAILRSAGSEVIVEDLGIVPDFVRASMTRLGVPGFRVLRWERLWHEEGHPFRDPSDYDSTSVATTGTHDTETLATWWDSLPEEDREKLAALPTVQRLTNGAEFSLRPFDDVVRDVLLEALLASPSDLVLLPVQDVFGWRDRINEPATVTATNWTFRLPWPCDQLDTIPEALDAQRRLRDWVLKYSRR